jgi:hypothetical protein
LRLLNNSKSDLCGPFQLIWHNLLCLLPAPILYQCFRVHFYSSYCTDRCKASRGRSLLLVDVHREGT